MRMITRLLRLARINFILMRYNIDQLILENAWFYPLRIFIYLNPYYWTLDKRLTRGERIRRALEDLGPIFVKAGQILSTRLDLLPDDIALELTKLQDRVPSFSGEIAKKMIEQSLGVPIDTIFSEFDPKALASASIAQVHAATLLTNEKVVIKVLRPEIKKIITRDIDLLTTLANMAERYWAYGKQFKPTAIINEIAQTLYDELDLMREGANASQLRRNFATSEQLYIPKVYWEFCRQDILILERIYGIPIHDIERLKQSGINLNQLANRAIEIFFAQVFRDSYFHADLHPGNLFVCANNPNDPTLIAVDFGMMGSLNHDDQRYLAENMIAFFKRDYQRVAELHIACGWIPPQTRIDQFEGAIRSVSEPILEQPLNDISFGQLLLRLFQVAQRFHINIQPQLILLQKTLLNIEGLCRQLAPNFDLWGNAAPQIERWLKKQVGIKAFLGRLRNNLPLWSEQLPELPSLLHEVLKETKSREERQRFQSQSSLDSHQYSLRKTKVIYFLFGTIVSAVALWLGMHG